MTTLTPEQIRMQRVEQARLDSEARRASYNSGGTIVPAEFTFTETQYEPPAEGVTAKELSELSQDDLFTGLAKQYRKSRVSFGYAGRDLTALVAFVDYITDTYKEERVSKNRNGKPTVEQVFRAIGWKYEAARKMRQRYRAAMRALPDYAPTPKPKQFSNGSTVLEEGDDTPYVVLGTPQPGEVEIVPENASSLDDVKVVPAEIVKRASVKKIKANDLIRDEKGNEYRYVGGGVLKRVITPAIAKKRDQEAAAIAKAREERTQAAVEAKAQRNKLRKAEDWRNALDLITEKPDGTKTKTQLEAETKQKAAKKVAQALKPAKPEKTKSKAELEAEKEKAEQEAAEKARRAKNDAATDASVAQQLRFGVQENGKPDFIGKSDADGAEVRQ